jgi:PRA1 family protein
VCTTALHLNNRVSSPTLLVTTCLSVAILVFLFPSDATSRSVIVSGRLLTATERRVIGVGAILLLLSCTGGVYRILYAVAVAGGLIVAHAVFRPRTILSKANRLHEEAKHNAKEAERSLGSSWHKALKDLATGAASRRSSSTD